MLRPGGLPLPATAPKCQVHFWVVVWWQEHHASALTTDVGEAWNPRLWSRLEGSGRGRGVPGGGGAQGRQAYAWRPARRSRAARAGHQLMEQPAQRGGAISRTRATSRSPAWPPRAPPSSRRWDPADGPSAGPQVSGSGSQSRCRPFHRRGPPPRDLWEPGWPRRSVSVAGSCVSGLSLPPPPDPFPAWCAGKICQPLAGGARVAGAGQSRAVAMLGSQPEFGFPAAAGSPALQRS